MKPVKISWIIETLNAISKNIVNADLDISSVHFNSQDVVSGGIFFALKGERDGHQFAGNAIENGAIAVVVSDAIDQDIPQIIVDDTLFALGELAKAYRNLFDIKLIGITGSVGKTTTREMLKTVLEDEFEIVSSRANFNNLIGLPITIFDINDNTEIAITELGINQPGEMDRLVEIANPDIGIITTIAPVHLEKLISMENIACEKVILFKAVSRNDGVCIYSLDDPLLDKVSKPYHGFRTTFGVKNDADFYADHISISTEGLVSFKVDANPINLKIPGIHNVYNALGAYSTGRHLKMDGKKIAQKLSSYTGFDNRMERKTIDGITFIDDSYNANPYSVKAGISTLISMDAERRFAVLGDMYELGTKEMEYHIEIIQYAIAANLDEIIIIGKRFSKALESLEVENDFSNLILFSNRSQVERYLTNNLSNGDIVLVKGSRKMKLDRIFDSIKDQIKVK